MRSLTAFVATVVLGAASLSAQQLAEQEFRDATVAFAAERFEAARDGFARAALTDVDNPEVFLWLGRSHYALGELDAALAAFRRTLELAPAEPLATRMVAALTGRTQDATRRLQLAEDLLRHGLIEAARAECAGIRANVVLDAPQRSRLALLRARVELERGDGAAALRELQALSSDEPAQNDRPEVQLALGRAEVLVGGEQAARGLARLARVVADHAAAPAGIRCQLELLRHALQMRDEAGDRAALAAWIEAQGDHESVVDARRVLLTAQLRAGSPDALPIAAALWPAMEQKERRAIVKRLLELIDTRFAEAPGAAIVALGALRALDLEAEAQRGVVRQLARRRELVALRLAQATVQAGTAFDGATAAAVQAARATLDELRGLDPAARAVVERLAFAVRLHGLAAPFGDDDLHPCDRHAVEIALGVVADARGDQAARNLILEIVSAAADRGIAGLRVASTTLDALADALGSQSAVEVWSGVQRRRLELVDALARAELVEALERGAGTAPREATDTQRALIDLAIERARRDRSAAGETIALVVQHARVFAAHDRTEFAAALVASLADGLPVDLAPTARAAAIGLRVDAVLRARSGLAAAGMPVAAELDPVLRGALEELYALEAACTPDQLVSVRELRGRIVDHFRGLDQLDVARTAIAVRATSSDAGADAWAELRLARLLHELALREPLQFSPAQEPSQVPPPFRAAVDAYLAFLRLRATSGLAAGAVEGTRELAARLQAAGGHDAAIEVYGQLERVLAELSAPAELRDRAGSIAFAAAAAADARARARLERHTGEAFDPQTRAAVDAALAAYAGLAASHPGSDWLAQVLPRQLDLAVEVARRGAWAEAERLLAQLVATGVYRVDQIEFCRALSMLGPVLGDQALALLMSAIAPPESETRSKSAPRDAGSAALERAGVFLLGADAVAIDSPAAVTVSAFVSTRELAAESDALLRTVRQLEQQRAQQIAALRGSVDYATPTQAGGGVGHEGLTAAEVERINRAFDRAYEALLALRAAYPHGAYAAPARLTIGAMIDRWRSSVRWAEAAGLAERFLTDEPDDAERDALRLGIARDLVSFAQQLPSERGSAHALLRTVGERFDRAREAFAVLTDDGDDVQTESKRNAVWERAATFLAQARTIARVRAALARGRFVLAARELSKVAAEHPDDPEATTVPDQLWAIGEELIGLGFHDETVAVRRELWVRHPTHPYADRAALSIAQLYRGPLGQPLRAAELFQELNFARGGADAGLQEAILAIGVELHAARRWVEALHVLESFLDGFPRHARAGEALTRIGQVHQANGAYDDAIAAYRRVIAEYPSGEHVSAARWSIAECWIHRSEWRRAMDGYVAFQAQYGGDERAAEAGRRVEVLKGLVRFQQVVDEVGQRKAFDAQFQIAVIVRDRLTLPRKAIAEFDKVPVRWPESHLADDALFEVGETWLSLGETTDARTALLRLADSYPESPLADDALYLVGKSFEDEADRLVAVTRADSEKEAQEEAQKLAYGRAQDNVRRFRDEGAQRVALLKSAGKLVQAEEAESSLQANRGAFRAANTQVFAQWASNEAEALTAAQLVDREDRLRAALRRAVSSYEGAARVAGGDKAGEALLRIARIQDARLEDAAAAMITWLEIVRQFSGTAVAEDASWRIAQFHDRHDEHRPAIEAYQAFLRNYRRSPNAGTAQAAIAENHEKLGEWVHAMDAYTNYINNFPDGPLVERAREQIAWIKTYRL